MAKKASNTDGGNYSFRKPNIDFKYEIKDLPWTFKQQEIIKLLKHRSTKCGLITGPAGTSKTIIAVYAGLQLLKEKHISDITYVRSAVESSSNKLGFLPGDINDKFEVYGTPFQDKLEELLDNNTIKMLKASNRVKALPINFLRGLSFSGNLIIIDEAQNFTYDELITTITRVGSHSRIWFLGDNRQSDLPLKHKKDFYNFCQKLSDDECKSNGIQSFNFEVEDIVRSEFCKFIVEKLKLYEFSDEYQEQYGTSIKNLLLENKVPKSDIWEPTSIC